MSSVLERLTDSADVFVDATLFGVAATYTPAGETASTSINVTFSEPGVIENPQQVGGETTQPAALARTVDVASAKYGDKLVIAGTTYRVTAAVPDGSGLTTLWLTVDASMQVPPAPTGLAATNPTSGNIPLTWGVNGSPTAIQVWRSTPNYPDAPIELIATLAANATSYTDTASDDLYAYTIVAINAVGPSAPSNEIQVDVIV